MRAEPNPLSSAQQLAAADFKGHSVQFFDGGDGGRLREARAKIVRDTQRHPHRERERERERERVEEFVVMSVHRATPDRRRYS